MSELFEKDKRTNKNRNRNRNNSNDLEASPSSSESSSVEAESDNNNNTQSSHDGTSWSREGNEEIDRIKRIKEKKLRKDSSLMVNSPLALALKNAIHRDPARSRAVESAIIARAKRPNTTTINMILKDEARLAWDHELLDLASSAQVYTQSLIFKQSDRNKEKSLHKQYYELKQLLDQDKILVNPQALHTILSSLITRHSNLLGILKAYKDMRPTLLQSPQNLQATSGKLAGLCYAYHFKIGGCRNPNCPYYHFCPLHPAERITHPMMGCAMNSARWTPKELEPPKERIKYIDPYKKQYRNYSGDYKRGGFRGGYRGRGRNNRGRYNKYDNDNGGNRERYNDGKR